MSLKHCIYFIPLLFLFNCDAEKSKKVTFSNAIRSTGVGDSSNGFKTGKWDYSEGKNQKSIYWTIHELDSIKTKLNLPSSFEVKHVPKAILFATDSVSQVRFLITTNKLSTVKTLEHYISLVKQSPDVENENFLGYEYYSYNQDSMVFGFAAKEIDARDFGYFAVYKKTKNAIIDYTYRYPLNEDSKWHQAVFWEILHSVNGAKHLEVKENKTTFLE